MVSSSSPTFKKTYPTRLKSSRGGTAQNESSAEESDVGSRHSSPRKRVPPSKGSETKPKRVDVFLPPPSPKRSRFAAVGESDPEPSPKPVSKTTRTPSVRANKGNTSTRPPTTPTPSLPAKPSSNSLNKSRRAASPAEAEDVKDQSKTKPVQRTEEERIQFLQEQPDCGSVEPHRAFCKRCNKWVGMSGRTTYPVYKWLRHTERCKNKELTASEGGESIDERASVADTPERTPRRNEEQRREFLMNDPRALIVKEWEVQCRACQKWIKLGAQRKYDMAPFNQHCGRCPGELSNGRVAISNRKLQLANDPQVKSFTVEAVVCSVCSLPVVLQGDGDYNLVKWQEHKLTCIPSTPIPIPIPFADAVGGIPRTPASNADTEATLVGTSLSPSRGKKRPRNDAEDAETATGVAAEDPDVRPAARRRTESYEPPMGFLPSLWKWATTEVRAFVRAAFGGSEETKEEAGETSAATSKT